METENCGKFATYTLSDEDRTRIMEVFEEDVIPKLTKLHARLGTISCEFAGERYGDWVIRFRSAGSGFEIVEFEYDEDAVGMDLDV